MQATIHAPDTTAPAIAPALNISPLALAALEAGVSPEDVRAYLTAPRCTCDICPDCYARIDQQTALGCALIFRSVTPGDACDVVGSALFENRRAS